MQKNIFICFRVSERQLCQIINSLLQLVYYMQWCVSMVAAIECPPLQLIANGFITYNPDNTPDYDIGTLATYTCDEGFAFASALTIQLRNCNDDDGMDAIGVWGGSAPTCVRK